MTYFNISFMIVMKMRSEWNDRETLLAFNKKRFNLQAIIQVLSCY